MFGKNNHEALSLSKMWRYSRSMHDIPSKTLNIKALYIKQNRIDKKIKSTNRCDNNNLTTN